MMEPICIQFWYDHLLKEKKTTQWQKCVRNNEASRPISAIAEFLVALWPRNTHNNISQKLQSECKCVQGMVWDDKSLCNQAVAQLHIWWILSFWATADKTVPALHHTRDGAGVFCAFSQGNGIENLIWLLYMNSSFTAIESLQLGSGDHRLPYPTRQYWMDTHKLVGG